MNQNGLAKPLETNAVRVWSFAGCEFEEARRILRVRGKAVEVEPKPLEILLQLLLHAGNVVSKDELLDVVWPGLAVVDGSLAVAISKLRKAIQDDDSTVILTVPRVGYRLGAPVHVKALPEVIELRAPSSGDTDRGVTAGGGARRRWEWIAAAAVIVTLVAGIVAYRRGAFGGPKVAVPSRITSLAVLPLVNLSGDPTKDYFADGMTEELITELSKIRALKVISRTSVMRYKGSKKTLPEIARDLNVDGIVEGSVLQSGNKIRVSAELIQAATDAHLWAESYDRDLQDVLNLQKELALQISREIKVTVLPSEEKALAATGPVNPEAHEFYLKGRYFWNFRTRDALGKAAEYFQQATQADPAYAQGYAGLADTYIEQVGFGQIDPADGIPKAKAAAQKAIQLDASLAEAHAAMAYTTAADWDWQASLDEFQKALQLNPGYVVALYQSGFITSMMARHDEAIRLTSKAVELDPLSQIVLYRAGRVQYQARHYDQAADLYKQLLELNPNDQLGLYGLGLVYEAQGDMEKAILCFKKTQISDGFELAAAYAKAGRAAEAKAEFDKDLSHLEQAHAYVRPGLVAEYYTAIGDKDAAMSWLEKGFKERDSWLALLKVWPRFDPLRSDPRFQNLLARMHFLN
jgi:TolB-like protein/DNA-binding winged helix-turn-helix (wHTH) protein/Tfp pilus assembly protein PilF